MAASPRDALLSSIQAPQPDRSYRTHSTDEETKAWQ